MHTRRHEPGTGTGPERSVPGGAGEERWTGTPAEAGIVPPEHRCLLPTRYVPSGRPARATSPCAECLEVMTSHVAAIVSGGWCSGLCAAV